ncbi:hypothetical protein [Paenibacillus dakarensis]|uniref:hypothetical protein n=1 Tax=Paenibacillus dakarensis TaxID=1527293 RepID=UPI000AB02E4E|nr:hypothetical protein [Paenibacillus dakarensis]
MSRIVMTSAYLNTLVQQLEQAANQLQQVDSALQHAIQSAAWQSSSRQNIMALYSGHQRNFLTAAVNMQELAAFARSTREKFEQEDQSGGTLGIAGFNPMAPLDGLGNITGTLLGGLAVARLGYRVQNGYMVRQQLDRRRPRILVRDSYASVRSNPIVNGRPRGHKIYYLDSVRAAVANGTASPKIKEIAAMADPWYGAKSALKDKLGWASVGIDIFTDTKENLDNNASSDEVAGDIIGNVIVGGATTVGATLLTAAIMPAAAPVLAVGAVGFGVSVGLTYLAEGVKLDVDLDNDGQDDSVKDIVKHGAKRAWSTVSGWFK